MKYEAIEKIYTDKVSEYLADGYTISSTTSGFLGNHRMIVDMKNKYAMVRVAMEIYRSIPSNGKEIENLYLYSLDTIKVSVYAMHISNYRNTSISTSEMELVEVVTELFNISDKSRPESGWFVEVDEAVDYLNKKISRNQNRIDRRDGFYHYHMGDRHYTQIVLNNKYDVLPFVRRQDKCKTKKVTDIRQVTKEIDIEDGYCKIAYCVSMKNGKTFVLSRHGYVMK